MLLTEYSILSKFELRNTIDIGEGHSTIYGNTVPFSSTYLCEKAFSIILSIKSKNRKKLDAELDLRCTLSICQLFRNYYRTN